MSLFLYLIIYVSILIFLIACVIRALQYARTPIHLRWELYPVPHEEPSRAKHGGSYFETGDWWTQKTHFNLWGEMKAMILEIIFLKGLWEFNRKMWFRSFPFHLGLYLLILTVLTLCVGAILTILMPVSTAGPLGSGIRLLYTLTGTLGLALGFLGSLGLLVLRLTDRRVKIYTTAGDIFNLLFFVVALAVLSAGFVLRTASAPDMLAVSVGFLTFDASVKIPGLLAAGFFLAAILIAYIPMTHMSHFIAKYFTYHSVRWDDAANRKRGKLEAQVAECLAYKPTWAAAHMKADGTKTWAQIATMNPALKEKG